MSTPSWVADRLALEQCFIRGLAREKPSLPELFAHNTGTSGGDSEKKQQLSLLAALATRHRFDMPAAPLVFEDDASVVSERNLVQGATRVALNRQFKRPRDSVVPASVMRVFTELKRRDLQVHPFDYVPLEHLINAFDASLFDNDFRMWGRNRNGESPAGGEPINTANWIEFPMPLRMDFIALLHRESADVARAVLTEHISGETAANRAKLLAAIQSSITPDDQPLLAGLIKDRSKIVQAVVEQMLAGIPGTAQHQLRIEAAISRLSLKKKRLTRQSVVAIDAPGRMKANDADIWYEKTFANINPSVLASALDVSRDEFLEAVVESRLARHCFVYAAKADDLQVVEKLAIQFEDELHKWIILGDADLMGLSTEVKSLCWSALVKRATADTFWKWCGQMQPVAVVLNYPMNETACESLLSGKGFKAALAQLAINEADDVADRLVELMALLPVCSFEQLSGRLAELPPLYITRASQLMTLLKLIESEHPLNTHNTID